MTHPTDAAIAQAFRETNTGLDSALDFAGKVVRRARELDAEKGGPTFAQAMREAGRSVMSTPPAQAAEAVERVARAIYANEWAPGSPAWAGLHDVNRIAWRNMARAAIAAMQAGEG